VKNAKPTAMDLYMKSSSTSKLGKAAAMRLAR
jgi:hypothetical protein